MQKLTYQTNNEKSFSIYGQVLKYDDQFLHFDDRYKGTVMIPIARIIEIAEAKKE